MSASRTVFEIFSVKEYRDLETGGKSRSRLLKMAPFDRSYTTFYCSAIVGIALIASFYNYMTFYNHDLEIWVISH